MALRRQILLVWRRGLRSLITLLIMPLIGAFLAIEASPGGLKPSPDMKSVQVLAILVTVAALTGSSLTYTDLVHDRDVLHRDHRIGVSATCLLAAKTIVFGVICGVMAVVMTSIYQWGRDLQPKAYGWHPYPLLLLVIFLVMISSLGLGMLISAIAKTLEQAVTLNTLLAMLQVVLNGSLFDLTYRPLQLFSLILPARLGFAAMASASNLNQYDPTDDALWDPSFDQFRWLLVRMAIVLVIAIIAAIFITERHWRGASLRRRL
ncbi:ABC transporter permease [Nonomuraea sp. 3N208]|uniref:ABC transporter permease n=1 Tax=Nonomuraea sp. 3N208 TaxID=3457421 RepID=UPI003FD66DE0